MVTYHQGKLLSCFPQALPTACQRKQLPHCKALQNRPNIPTSIFVTRASNPFQTARFQESLVAVDPGCPRSSKYNGSILPNCILIKLMLEPPCRPFRQTIVVKPVDCRKHQTTRTNMFIRATSLHSLVHPLGLIARDYPYPLPEVHEIIQVRSLRMVHTVFWCTLSLHTRLLS